MNIVVIMATCNGAPYIRQQVKSIFFGDLRPSRLIVRDDLSTDETVDILHQMASESPIPLDVARNPERLGVARNFLHMLRLLPEDTDLVAFADQDDIWAPWKLSRACETLRPLAGQPALYCSRQTLIDHEGKVVGLSPPHHRGPSFANALVQNIVTGCTMVINRPLLQLALALPEPDVPLHDWWFYLLTTGTGGTVIFDTKPGISYRQHDRNVTGNPTSLFASLKGRVRRFVTGRSRQVIDANLSAIAQFETRLTNENREIFRKFITLRNATLPARLKVLREAPFHRQTYQDDLIARVLFIMGKL